MAEKTRWGRALVLGRAEQQPSVIVLVATARRTGRSSLTVAAGVRKRVPVCYAPYVSHVEMLHRRARGDTVLSHGRALPYRYALQEKFPSFLFPPPWAPVPAPATRAAVALRGGTGSSMLRKDATGRSKLKRWQDGCWQVAATTDAPMYST